MPCTVNGLVALCQVEYLSEYMRDFIMTHGQKTEIKRHFNFKLSFNSVRPGAESKTNMIKLCS